MKDYSISFAGYVYARDILDIEPWKSNKQDKIQNEWKLINPFAAPFVKPKKAFRFTELRLLFYTRLVVNFILTLLVTGGGGCLYGVLKHPRQHTRLNKHLAKQPA